MDGRQDVGGTMGSRGSGPSSMFVGGLVLVARPAGMRGLGFEGRIVFPYGAKHGSARMQLLMLRWKIRECSIGNHCGLGAVWVVDVFLGIPPQAAALPLPSPPPTHPCWWGVPLAQHCYYDLYYWGDQVQVSLFKWLLFLLTWLALCF